MPGETTGGGGGGGVDGRPVQLTIWLQHWLSAGIGCRQVGKLVVVVVVLVVVVVFLLVSWTHQQLIELNGRIDCTQTHTPLCGPVEAPPTAT